MSLSDTCAETIATLRGAFVQHADWGYSASELNRIINSIYDLADFMVRQDVSPRAPIEKVNEIVDGVVVAGILDTAHDGKVDGVCKTLAEISKVNSWTCPYFTGHSGGCSLS